jgi:S-adenosylmethionine:tRNA ribosyltransferase-isomerase
MHSEWGVVGSETVQAVRGTRSNGGRVIAVGTTSARLLETASRDGELTCWEGETDIFIFPPFEFQSTDALMTNFHLPRSTLLMMVRAFGGDELIRRAYVEAINEEYRFYSYGDTMLIL